jgi:hypothetical protein
MNALGPEVYKASKRNQHHTQKEMLVGRRAWPVRTFDNLTTICD